MFWIRIKTNLPACPEVVTLASRSSVTGVTLSSRIHVTVGALVATWAYLDAHGIVGDTDAIIENMTPEALDEIIGVPGWAEGLQKVNWLRVDGNSLVFPNYGVHNSPTSKQRHQNQIRQQRHRTLARTSVTSVTQVSRTSVTKKRREEKRVLTELSSDSGTNVPSSSDNSVCAVAVPATTPAPPTEPAIITFPCSGPVPTWGLSQRQADEWSGQYAGLDILGEVRKALAWVNANQRKTARGMPRFLAAWLARACDRMPIKPRNMTQPGPTPIQRVSVDPSPIIQTLLPANTNGTNGWQDLGPSPWEEPA